MVGRGSGGRDAGLAFQSAERIRYQVLGVRVTRLSSKGLSAQADVTIRESDMQTGAGLDTITLGLAFVRPGGTWRLTKPFSVVSGC